MKLSNKKKLIFGSIIGILLGTLIGGTYAFFVFQQTGANQQLITGDIYMRYTESNEVVMENMFPSSGPVEGQYIEFDITGKNTSNKTIYYEILLNHGSDITGKTRIGDQFLRFKLVEVTNNVEGSDLLGATSFNPINGNRIYVSTIGTTNVEISKKYRLYVWIDSGVTIYQGDDLTSSDGDYSASEWNSLFGSIRVDVTGDFTEKRYDGQPIGIGDPLYMKVRESLTAYNSDTDEDNVTFISGCSDEETIDGTTCTANNKIDFNFVWYSGKLWRIVSIDSNGGMKLITENPITVIYWGSNTTYDGSWVQEWLNEDFKDTLKNTSTVIDSTKKWNATETTATTKQAETTMVTGDVGLLNAYESTESYKMANNTYGKGYLNIKQWWWLITPSSSSGVRHVHHGGNLYSSGLSGEANSVRPSINLSSGVKFAGGNGSRNNPYRIGEDISAPETNAVVSSRVSGEYVTFKNELYRIVDINTTSNTTKIVKADYLTDNSTLLTKYFASSAYFGKAENTQTDDYWDYYLNNTWLTSSDLNMLAEGTYYLGEYGSTGISYKATICDREIEGNLNKRINSSNAANRCTRITDTGDGTKVYTGYAGLLRVGEMFSSQLKTMQSSYQYMWLITPYGSFLVRNVYGNGYLSYDNPSSNVRAVRPSVNLKSGVYITNASTGDGTEAHPWTIAAPSQP